MVTPSRFVMLAMLVSMLAALATADCKSKTFTDPEYLSDRLQAGDELAFRYVRRLEDPEARVAAIPALVDAYSAGVQPDEILRILLDIGHPDGLPAFLEALESDDTRLAGLAARGIAAVGAVEHVSNIASRLGRVRDPSQYEPFLDALRSLPGRPEVAEVLNGIMTRPAGRIGGINTVRYGCEILGGSGNTEAETVQAMLFGYVNFIPQPFQDARLECQLALIKAGESAAEPLWQAFMGQNEEINTHLRSMRYTPVVGQLRAAWALADGQMLSVRDQMLTWFNTEQIIDRATLSAMPLEDQQTWFLNYGQMFEQATAYLGWIATDEEGDPAVALLRSMMARGEGSPLENFRQFMNTSDGAELGVRAAVFRALVNVGDPADRDTFLQVAMAGNLQRGNDLFIRQEGAHAFALMSVTGDRERYQEVLNSIEEPAQREHLEAYMTMINIAEECQLDVDCLAGHLNDADIWAREKAVYDLSHYVEDEVRAAAALLDALEHPLPEARLVFTQALRHLELPQTASERITELLEADNSPRFRDFRHELRVLRQLKFQ